MNTLLQLAQSYEYSTYSTSSNLDPETSAALSAGLIVFFLISSIISYVIYALFLGKIFKKAGIESWIAWVPFYNSWKLLEAGGQQGFWAILAVIPFVSIVSAVFMFIAMYNIGLKLGKTGYFVLLAIFLPIVWLIWLAVDKSVWNNTLGAPSKAPEHTGATTAV
jgi:Family of unknown function (DUF5684)